MRVIGLTGGIACGKSTVSQQLSRLGAVIVDGDVIARQLTAPGGLALPELQRVFGPNIFDADEQLNRKALGNLVFSDPRARDLLDQIMQPMIYQEILIQLDRARNAGCGVCVLDMPLLYEKKLDILCDTVWCVSLPQDEQLRRLMARDHLTPEAASQRIASQMPVAEKAARAQTVIENTGTVDQLIQKVSELYQLEVAPKPVQRRRRSDIYAEQAPVTSQPAPPIQPMPLVQPIQPVRSVQPAAPVQTPRMERPAQAVPPQRTERATRMERPPSVQELPQKKPSVPLPKWIPLCMLLLFFIGGGLFAAEVMMTRYLEQQEAARVAAHQSLLDHHPTSAAIMPFIHQYAEKNNLNPAYVCAIILNESSFRTNAESGIGARGLMQVMEDTAEWIAHKLDVKDYSFEMLWDAETNIRFGCWYLGWLSEQFGGDPVAVTAAYHAGQGQVAQWLSNPAYSADGRTLTVENMPAGNTKAYAERVTQAYAIYDALYFHMLNPLPDADGPADDSLGLQR